MRQVISVKVFFQPNWPFIADLIIKWPFIRILYSDHNEFFVDKRSAVFVETKKTKWAKTRKIQPQTMKQI